MAYFILRGSVGVGYFRDDEYEIVNYLREGYFFGEIAALTGAHRTANVITEEDSEFLIIPAKVLRELSGKYPGLKQVVFTTIAERLKVIELPRGITLDQDLLRELRTNQPETKDETGRVQIGV
jgi:CRP-like cAMP-binding protein